jgi:8-oxo-dGTP pyrophosphatase MutT (NUDIX family)
MEQTIIDQSWYLHDPDIQERISAGGVIIREGDGCPLVALARENDFPRFVLPKGGVKKGETITQAARREILEEAGLDDLTLVRYLGMRQRLSFDKQRWLVVHYFLFTTLQIIGKPTDSKRHHGVWWHPMNCLPEMLWPEQSELVSSLLDEACQLFTHPSS